jgi:hypothetical protein
MSSTAEYIVVEHTEQLNERLREIKRETLELHARLTRLAQIALLLADDCDDAATRH